MPVSKVFQVGDVRLEVFATKEGRLMVMIQTDITNPIDAAMIELDRDDAQEFASEVRAAVRLLKDAHGQG